MYVYTVGVSNMYRTVPSHRVLYENYTTDRLMGINHIITLHYIQTFKVTEVDNCKDHHGEKNQKKTTK